MILQQAERSTNLSPSNHFSFKALLIPWWGLQKWNGNYSKCFLFAVFWHFTVSHSWLKFKYWDWNHACFLSFRLIFFLFWIFSTSLKKIFSTFFPLGQSFLFICFIWLFFLCQFSLEQQVAPSMKRILSLALEQIFKYLLAENSREKKSEILEILFTPAKQVEKELW